MLNKQEIVEAFNKMDFGVAVHDTSLAHAWLQKRKVDLKTGQVDVKTCPEKTVDCKTVVDIFKKVQFFREITSELRKNVDLLVQLEMVVRGFSYKDSLKSVNLFLDYLEYTPTESWEHSIPYPYLSAIRFPESLPMSYIGGIMANININGEKLFANTKLTIIFLAIYDIISHIYVKYDYQFPSLIKTNIEKTEDDYLPLLFLGRTPVLIFHGADLESSCESVVNAAYSEQGQMPWSVNTVFVQENIFDEVVLKLKNRLRTVKIGASTDKQVDFSVPSLLGDYEVQFAETLAHAKAKGIDVFQPEDSKFIAMFIGGKVYGNKVVEEKTPCVPFINVMAFRSIKEGISLANNQQQSFAACVWANDVGLVHEVIHGLEVDTIWINTHGVFHPSTRFPLEDTDHFASLSLPWSKNTQNERIKMLQDIGMRLSTKFEANTIGRKIAEQMVTLQMPAISNVQIYGKHELKQFPIPIGNLDIFDHGNLEVTFKSVCKALVLGNSVALHLVDQTSSEYNKLCETIGAEIPGILIYTQKYPYFYRQQIFKNIWTAIGENYV